MSAPCPALGFVVDVDTLPSLSPEGLSTLHRDWSAFLGERGLRAHAQRAGSRLRFEVVSEAAQATQSDRAAVEVWLAARTELGASSVGEIHDLRPDG